MSRIIFNGNNFGNSLKRGLSLVLTLTTLSTFVGCSSNENNDARTENSSIVGTVLDENKSIYDFLFTDTIDIEDVSEVYDWSETENIIKVKNNEAWKLIYTGADEVTGISKNRYAAIICEDANDFGNTYYRIIDTKGNSVEEDKVEDIFKVDDHNFIYCDKSAVDRDGLENTYNFTIFNQITGKKTTINALSLTGFNGFVIKSSYEKNNEFGQITYELLNVDGTKSIDILYDEIEFDYETGILYLTKDGITEAVEPKTKKARKIDGVVEESSNGYIVVRRNDENISSVDVLQLTDINEEPKLLMSYDASEISIGVADNENPMFVIMKYNNEITSYDCLFVDKNNSVLAEGKYDFILREYKTDMLKGFKYVKIGDDRIALVDLIDADGQIIADDISHDYFDPISGRNIGIFRDEEGSKYGVRRFNGGYLIQPSFDELYTHSIYREQEDGSLVAVDCYLVGRLEREKQTAIYTRDLEEIGRGDYGLLDAEDIADAHYVEKANSKKIVKEN